MQTLEIQRAVSFGGEVRVPSDKSITHRALILGAIAKEPSMIHLPLLGEDCFSTIKCLAALGVRFEGSSHDWVKVIPPPELITPEGFLDCGNSGTTMRLLAGVIASRPIRAELRGDASLSQRPMKRIATPLRLMGATFEGDSPPVDIIGRELEGIRYESPIASAQIKTCVLLAGLRATGVTTVIEPAQSRDHTERMLSALDVQITRKGLETSVSRSQPSGFEVTVGADPSAAAFWAVAAALIPGEGLTLKDVILNETRTGAFSQLPCTIVPTSWQMGEQIGDIVVEKAINAPFEIRGSVIPTLIDEIPILCVYATQCEGTSVIRDAGELRVKESDRIEVVAKGLSAMGAHVEVFDDGLTIHGPTPLRGATIDSAGDHRIGMSFAIAGLLADGTTTILNSDAIATSYPEFEDHLRQLIRI